MPEVDTAAVRARLGAFLVAWKNRIGNDRDRIYNLDGGIEWDGGTSLLHSDIAALLAEVDDLRSRLACVAEATSMDRPYDTRIAAIRGMCDLTTNGLTPAAGDHPTPSDGSGVQVVDGATDPCPAPGYAGRHTAVGAGAISPPYICHGCGAAFTITASDGIGTDG